MPVPKFVRSKASEELKPDQNGHVARQGGSAFCLLSILTLPVHRYQWKVANAWPGDVEYKEQLVYFLKKTNCSFYYSINFSSVLCYLFNHFFLPALRARAHYHKLLNFRLSSINNTINAKNLKVNCDDTIPPLPPFLIPRNWTF